MCSETRGEMRPKAVGGGHLKDIGDSLGKAPEVLETFLAMLTELLGTFFLLCLEM